MSQPTPESTALAEAAIRHAQQVEEWSKYVAVNPISFGGVLAFRAGEAVPVGHVEPDRFGLLANKMVRLRSEEPEEGEDTAEMQAVGVPAEPPGSLLVSGEAPVTTPERPVEQTAAAVEPAPEPPEASDR